MSFSGYKGRNPLNLTLTRRGKNRSYCCWGESELPANLRRCSCVLTTTTNNNLRHNFKLFPLLLNDATEDLYGPLRSDQEKAITTTHYIYSSIVQAKLDGKSYGMVIAWIFLLSVMWE